jgi:hypothetical protein
LVPPLEQVLEHLVGLLIEPKLMQVDQAFERIVLRVEAWVAIQLRHCKRDGARISMRRSGVLVSVPAASSCFSTLATVG